VKPELDLYGLLTDLARAECCFVVIGSSALAMQSWKVSPGDLDLMAAPNEAARIEAAIGLAAGAATLMVDGEARRLECRTERGEVDIYFEVSGGLTFEVVRREAITVLLGNNGLSVAVGSFEHVRDMRAAAGRASVPQAAVSSAVQPGSPKVVAIDGPGGAGKSTVARAVASELGFTYLDTGAMYRCIALAVLTEQADTDDREAIGRIANDAEIEFRCGRVILGGEDVSRAIRANDVTEVTSHISAYPEVRDAMVNRQRLLFCKGEYVVEGRDTGTVVVPEAPLKVFLTATPQERAERRAEEAGEAVAGVRAALEERDRLDSERKISALRKAEDAVVIDTTGRSVQDVTDEIVHLARERGIA
jgi:CMP/dCMP kinase